MRTFATTILAFFLFAGLSLEAQIEKRWDIQFGAAGDEGCYSAVTTPDGGVLLAGTAKKGMKETGDPSHGGYDYWVVKLDARGFFQWDRNFGGQADEKLWLALPLEDGFLLGGFSLSEASGNKTAPSQGGADYWLVRLDTQGKKIWDKSYGSAGLDLLYTLTPASDGNFLLGGASFSQAGGDKTEPSRGMADYWIVKIDPEGNKLWDKRYGGPSSDFLQTILPTADGGFLLGGHSASGSGGDKTEPSRGGYDYWVLKIDAEGGKQWDKRYGGNMDDYCYGLQPAPDGQYLVAGYSFSSIYGDRTQISLGSSDFWVLKIDATGKKVWEEAYGGPGTDRLYSMIPAQNGRYLLIGDSNSDPGGDKTDPSHGGFDGWVVQIDEYGNRYWDKTFGTPQADYLVPGLLRPDGGFLFAGGSKSDGMGQQLSGGPWNFWMVETSANCSELTWATGAEILPASCLTLADGAIELKVSGGAPPYTYQWSNGATSSVIYNLLPGIYEATVDEASGCRGIFAFEVGIHPPALEVDITPCQTIYTGYTLEYACADIAVEVWGGCPPYTYAWNTGEVEQAIRVCPELNTSYTVTVVDAVGQEVIATADVEVLDIRCGNNLDKILICHQPPGNPDESRTLCVSPEIVPDFLARGGSLGPCGWPSCSGYTLALAIARGDLDPKLVLGEATGWEETPPQPTLYLYPNPAADYLIADLRFFPEGEYAISIFDRTGTQLISRVVEVPGSVQWKADLSGFPVGWYWIQVRGEQVAVDQKFVVGSFMDQ